jgi:flagellar biosynthesis/type III secretory pathway protein FliH
MFSDDDYYDEVERWPQEDALEELKEEAREEGYQAGYSQAIKEIVLAVRQELPMAWADKMYIVLASMKPRGDKE